MSFGAESGGQWFIPGRAVDRALHAPVGAGTITDLSGGWSIDSAELLRLLLESVSDYAILMLDPSGDVLSWNRAAEQITGYRPDEIIGRHFSCFYPADAVVAGRPQRELREAAARGRYEEEGLRLRKDGSSFWANVVISAIRADGGSLLGFAKVTRDVSERRRAQVRLALQGVVAANMAEGVVLVNVADGSTIYTNPAFEVIFGNSKDALAAAAGGLPRAVDERAADEIATALERERRWSGELRSVRRDGTPLWCAATISVVEHPEHGALWIGVYADITPRKRLEAELAHQHNLLEQQVAVQTADLRAKNEALERDAREISRLGLERRRLVAQALQVEERHRQLIAEALHDHALQDLLTARQELHEAPAEAGALGRAASLLDAAILRLREAMTELHPIAYLHDDLPSAIRSLAERAAASGNLACTVAVDAAAAGVADQLALTITRELLGNVVKHAGAQHASIRLEAGDAGAMAITVADDGVGMRPQRRADALAQGHIGLALIAARVDALGGTFAVTSAPGAGTTARATIPLAPTAAPPPRVAR